MPYIPTVWVDDGPPPIDQVNLNKIEGGIQTAQADVDTHVADTANPHGVTAAQVGLGDVDDTADVDKPVSTATQTALDLKVDESLVDAKGDLIVATANDTPARLAVGSDGDVLTADAAEATGVKWAAGGGGGSPAGISFAGTFGHNPSHAMDFGVNAGMTANRASYIRFVPARDMLITKMVWRSVTGTGNYDIGVYRASDNARLWSKGSTAWPGNTTVVIDAVSPALPLTAGTVYYIAIVFATFDSLRLLSGFNADEAGYVWGVDGGVFHLIENSAMPLPATATPAALTSTFLSIPIIVLRED